MSPRSYDASEELLGRDSEGAVLEDVGLQGRAELGTGERGHLLEEVFLCGEYEVVQRDKRTALGIEQL